VGLAWTPTPDASLAEFQDYEITVRRGSTLEQTVTAAKNATGTQVNSLIEGNIYTFEVVARAAASSNYTNSPMVSIEWSPAKRLENEQGLPAPIKVYETSSSSSFASGLIFYRASMGAPHTVSIVGADSSLIDVYVKTEAGNAVSLNSSSVFRPGRRITRFSTTVRNDSTLNNPQALPPDTSTFNNFSILIDSLASATSKIYYFKGNDGNYGRILVERNPANGTLIWGSSPEQYLSMRLSYQSVPFNPYAKSVGNDRRTRRFTNE
jgi:hypothetical protein